MQILLYFVTGGEWPDLAIRSSAYLLLITDFINSKRLES